jgi:hypothetical protein
MLTQQLKLTSDQQLVKVLDTLKSEQSQTEKLRSDSSLSQDDHPSKMTDIRKASDDQIRALLDSDQQKSGTRCRASADSGRDIATRAKTLVRRRTPPRNKGLSERCRGE